MSRKSWKCTYLVYKQSGGHVPVHNAFETGVLLNDATQPGSKQNTSQSLISLACQGRDGCVIL